MSYCRLSSNNWDCDLYCYADVHGGYTTHVASRRHKGPITLLPDARQVTSRYWAKAYKKQREELKESNLVSIGLPEDGKSFNDPTPELFLARVISLKEMGYHVPDYVIERIKKECK